MDLLIPPRNSRLVLGPEFKGSNPIFPREASGAPGLQNSQLRPFVTYLETLLTIHSGSVRISAVPEIPDSQSIQEVRLLVTEETFERPLEESCCER